MSYLDIRIRELMNETEEHLLRSSQQLGWLGLIRAILRGRLGLIVWLNLVTQIVLLIVAIWAGIKFFDATEMLPALKYGLSSAALIVVAMQFKTSLMPHIQTERVLRAMKRIEILILAQHDNK